MQKREDPGKFRQLDEILFVDGYPEYQHLLSTVENCMQVVCDVKGDMRSPYLELQFESLISDLMIEVNYLVDI